MDDSEPVEVLFFVSRKLDFLFNRSSFLSA